MTADNGKLEEALDTISVAPPEPEGEDAKAAGKTDADATEKPQIREAHDAGTHEALARDPHHEDAKLDIGLDESFPTSDPPAHTAPGHGDPAPSSGYDEEAERKLAEAKR